VTPPPPRSRRSGYRHGNLRAALVDAGLELARAGGPDAVVLREATRRVGVVPNAAYRHFADRGALLQAVCTAAMDELAGAMAAELDARGPGRDPEAARERLRAIGAAYVRFAQRQPGLFLTAFSTAGEASGNGPPEPGTGRPDPFGLLGRVLDELVTAGALPPDRRADADFAAWAAVHGLAMLLVGGPLHGLAPEDADRVERHLLEVVVRGL
jgi:AcrR family transcriptional regulator